MDQNSLEGPRVQWMVCRQDAPEALGGVILSARERLRAKTQLTILWGSAAGHARVALYSHCIRSFQNSDTNAGEEKTLRFALSNRVKPGISLRT